MSIKENFATNLIKYRKAASLTQAELAEKINYSDKAVSKWERGESLPDLEVVKNIADLFDVTVDAMIAEPKEDKIKLYINANLKRILIYLAVTGFVWLVAICCFAFLNIIFPTVSDVWPTWLALIYALPITSFIIYFFACVWQNRLLNLIFASSGFWTLILAVYLTLIMTLHVPPKQLWEIFLIGIPIQALLLFRFFYKKLNKRHAKKS